MRRFSDAGSRSASRGPGVVALCTALVLGACGGSSGDGDPAPAALEDPTASESPFEPTGDVAVPPANGSSGEGPASPTVDATPPENGGDETPETPAAGPVAEVVVTVDAGAGGRADAAILRLPEGGTARVTFTADPGFALERADGCPGRLEGEAYVIDGPPVDCTVYALFRPRGTRLTVDVFGEGRVSGPTDFACGARSTCERVLDIEDGTVITLEATPDTGWTFSGWRGCDEVAGTTCRVTAAPRRSVTPLFASATPPVLQDGVVVLDGAQLDALESVDARSLVFDASATGIAALPVGTVLVSSRDDGFARRITRIVALPGTAIIVQTREASLVDIVREGTLVLESGGVDDRTRFIPAPGITIDETDGRRSISRAGISIAGVLYDDDGDPSTTDDQVRVRGSLDMAFDPVFAVDIGLFGLDEVVFGGNASATVTPSVEWTFDGARDFLTDSGLVPEDGFPLGRFVSPPVVFGPVVLVPTYDVFLEPDLRAEARLTASVSVTFKGSAGVHWRRRGDPFLDGTADFSADGAASASARTDFEASLWAYTRMQLLLFGQVGPLLEVGPRATYRLRVPLAGTEAACLEESLSVGLPVVVGGNLGKLAPSLRWQADIVPELSFPIRLATDGLERLCTGEAAPLGPPRDLVATFVPDVGVVLEWDSPTGVQLQRYAISRDGRLLDIVLGDRLVDRTASPDRTLCYTVTGFDGRGDPGTASEPACLTIPSEPLPPSAPEAPLASNATTTGIELDWSVPTDATPGTEYVVSVDGRELLRTVDTEATVTQLLPFTDYCFAISAIDERGLVSSPSARSCARTLADGAGLWRMRIACAGQAFSLENRLDLDVANTGVVNVAGDGLDYNGTALAYVMGGTFDFADERLDARITWTFESDDDVRVDEFSADLSSTDTGNIVMRQVQVTGCDAIIRFDQVNDTSPAARGSAPAGTARPVGGGDWRGFFGAADAGALRP